MEARGSPRSPGSPLRLAACDIMLVTRILWNPREPMAAQGSPGSPWKHMEAQGNPGSPWKPKEPKESREPVA